MTEHVDPVEHHTARAVGAPVECPELGTFEAAPLAPDIFAHVEICDSCQLVVELLAGAAAGDDCIQFEPLLAARADGAIGRAAGNLLDRHLASCNGCRAVAETLAPTADAEGDHASLPRVDPASYALGLEVDRGGMGRILAARDLRVGRPVAVKELLGRSRQLAVRFEREARITARLQHPGIVPIYEIGRWPDGTPFYSMRMVDGGKLRDAIDNASTLAGRLALLPAVIAATEAVAFAHAQRIIHRDLTPSNVLVGAYGETVVIDWGLAKNLADANDDEPYVGPDRTSEGLTGIGAVLGTAAYMPPEQANGEAVDERADVYALGAILYHLLAGAAPYRARKTADLLRDVKAGPPKPVELISPGAPRDLVSIVEKAMARKPEGRYPSARELTDELKRFQTGRMVEAHEYTSAERMRRFIVRNRGAMTVTALAVVMIAVLGAVAIRRVYREKTAATNTVNTLLQEEGRIELLAGNSLRALAYLDAAYKGKPDSPSLKFLIHTALQDVASAEGDLDCGPDSDVRSLGFSPDGTAVIAGCRNVAMAWRLEDRKVIARFPPAGDAPIPRAFDDITYSHDGKTVATWGAEGTARLWDAKTGTLLRSFPHGDATITFATFSPDDRIVATTAYDGQAKIWDATSGALLRTIVGNTGLFRDLYGVLSPDGKVLITVTFEGTSAGWNVETGEKIREFDHGGLVLGGKVSPDGAYAVTSGIDRIVRVWDLKNPKPFRQLAGNTDVVWACRFSYDSKRVVCVGHDGRAYVWDLATGATIAAVNHGLPLWVGHFAPDGRRFVTLAFDGSVKVWDTASSGLLASHETRGGKDVRFSPDGRHLVAGRGDGRIRIWSAADGPMRTTFTPEPEEKIAMVSRSGAQVVVEQTNPDGDDWITLHDTATGAVIGTQKLQAPIAISADTDRVAAVATDHRISVIDLRTARQIATLTPPAPPNGLAISDDGMRLAIWFRDRPLEVWSIARQTRIATLAGATRAILSGDGRRALAWQPGEAPRVWEVDTETRGVALAPYVAYQPLGFAFGGTRIVLAEHADEAVQTLTLWNADSGSKLDSLESSIAKPAIDAKRMKLTTILADRSVVMWNLSDGSRSAFVGQPLQQAEVDPTGNFIAGIGKDGDSLIVLDALDGRLLARWPIAHDPPSITLVSFNAPLANASWSRDGESIVAVSSRVAVWSAGTKLPGDFERLIHGNVPWKVEAGHLAPALVRVHGRVHRGDAPVANASIAIVIRKPPELGSVPTTFESTAAQQTRQVLAPTNALGEFERDKLAPGEYSITVTAPDSSTRTVEKSVTVEDEEVDIDLAGSIR